MGDYRPDYLTTVDYNWLSRILEVYEQGNGLPLHRIHSRLDEVKIPESLNKKYQRVRRFLDKKVSTPNSTCSAREIRMIVFTKIFSRSPRPSSQELQEILKVCSNDLGIDKSALANGLLADIDGEQIVDLSKSGKDIYEIANLANLMFVRSLLRSSFNVTIFISDSSRRVMRQAKLNGLICLAEKTTGGLCLRISGPLSLFRRTMMYGKALSSMIETVVWCENFSLMANCRRGDRDFRLVVKSGDPIRTGKKPRSYDSKLEEKFAASVAKNLPHWRLIREPEPIETTEGVMFPDFLLEHLSDEKLRFYCEIVGFWTKDYLEKKLRQWSCVKNCRFVLCMSEKLKVSDDSLPEDIPLYFFNSSIKVQDLIKLAFPEIFRT